MKAIKPARKNLIKIDTMAMLIIFGTMILSLVLGVNFLQYNATASLYFTNAQFFLLTGLMLYVLAARMAKTSMFDPQLVATEIVMYMNNTFMGLIVIGIFTMLGMRLTYSTLSSLPGTLLYVLVLISAIAEEIAFRGGILNMLRVITGDDFISAVLSSIIFGIAHMAAYNANFVQMIVAMIAGMVFAIIDLRTNSITPSMLAHLIWNAL